MFEKNNDPFELESIRDELSRRGAIVEFRNSYKFGNPEIKNSNTGEMWDVLNTKIVQKDNPMAYDRIQTLVKFIKGKSLEILDYGFGQGALEEQLVSKDKCRFLFGIDISKQSVKKAQKKYKKWKFVKGDYSSTDIKPNSFDYVISSEVLEHISPINTFNVLKFFKKVLRKEGYLIISVPLNEDLEKMVKNNLNINAHVRIYTQSIIETELKISGFKVIKHELLYAFHKFYFWKKLFLKVFRFLKKPNVIVILAQKV